MARKKRQDRRGVASHVVTVRLDDREREGLDDLVRTQNVKLREMRMPAVVTRASYIRSLIGRELEALGKWASTTARSPEPETLVLVPPRKKLRRTIKKMPGLLTVERTVAEKTPPKDVSPDPASPRRSVWERIIASRDMFEDPKK